MHTHPPGDVLLLMSVCLQAPGGLQEREHGEEPGPVHAGALRVLQPTGEEHGLGLGHAQLGLPGQQVSGGGDLICQIDQ